MPRFSTAGESHGEARVAFGPALTHKEAMRASLGLRWWDSLGADLRYAARMLRKSPGFTAVAAISLALAIGANATIFSLTKQLLYERLAVPDAANLRLLAWIGTEDHVAVHHLHGSGDASYEPLPGGRLASTSFSYAVFQQLRSANGVLDDIFAFENAGMNATILNEPQRVRAELVSGNYYESLGVRPQLGRAIHPSDDTTAGTGAVAVISDGLWERAFGSSPSVLGQTIKLNDTQLTIVGVNPRGFTGAKDVQVSPDVFVPLSMQPRLTPPSDGVSWLSNPQQWWLTIMGRAHPGVELPQAQAALDTRLNAIVRGTMPVRAGEDIPRMDLRDGSRGLFDEQKKFAQPMAVLMTLVGLVLLLACANIANLMLARGTHRQREMSVRLALGAGRIRILHQILVESILLAMLGGAGGLLAAYLGRNAIPRLLENAWQRTDFHVRFDWRVFAFTAAVTLLTGVVFGLAPAWAAMRSDVNCGLKEGAQNTTRRRKGSGGRALVGFQIAISTLLVIGAGLFLRTLAGLTQANIGFRTDHLLLAAINPSRAHYAPGEDIRLHRRVEEALAAVPGVESVAPSFSAYIDGDTDDTDFLPEGESFDRDKKQEEFYNGVGNRFFETLGIPIVAGRAFGEQETPASPRVAIVNQALARKRFPGQNPVGKRFRTDVHDSDGRPNATGDDWIQIVGVCGDTRYADLRNEPPPQFFLPYVQQSQVGGMVYYIHTRLEPHAILPGLRSVVSSIDPDLAIVNARTQREQIDSAMQNERVLVSLTSGFGLLALALASVGIYGIMAYSVASRTSEIGIRLALGAQPRQVRGMILGESAWLAAAGVVAGVAAALVLARLVKSMLYGIEAWDPVTIGGGVIILMAVALAASWLPARRAASVQPMQALRHE
jgi:predicted permease